MDSEVKKLKTMELECIRKEQDIDIILDDEQTSITKLNNDCLAHIFSFLTVVERMRIERVCKRWRETISMSWSSVKTLEIRNDPNEKMGIKYSIPILRRIFSLCGKYLRNFLDYGSKNLCPPMEMLKLLQERCPNLRTLWIEEMIYTEKILTFLTENFPYLAKFDAYEVPKNSEDALSKFFASKDNLRHVVINPYGNSLTGKCLLHLKVDCIEHLAIGELKSTSYFEQIVPKLVNLSELHIRCNRREVIDAETFKFLDLLPRKSHLTSLDLLFDTRAIYREITFEFLKKFTNLKDLEVIGPQRLCIRALRIAGSHCKNLIVLWIHSYHDGFIRDIKDTKEMGLYNIRQLPHFYDLQITFHGGLVPGELFTVIMPQLSKLNCINCSNLCSDNLSFILENSTKLEALNICCCDGVNLKEVHDVAIKTVNARTNGVSLHLQLKASVYWNIHKRDIKDLNVILTARKS